MKIYGSLLHQQASLFNAETFCKFSFKFQLEKSHFNSILRLSDVIHLTAQAKALRNPLLLVQVSKSTVWFTPTWKNSTVSITFRWIFYFVFKLILHWEGHDVTAFNKKSLRKHCKNDENVLW